jgi:hypothetical protein
MINQYPYTEREYPQPKNFNKIFYVLLAIVLIIITILIIFRILKPSEAECGNNICESTETQGNCCLDCGCSSGYECLNNVCRSIVVPSSTSTVIPSRCGNDVCEPEENCYDCPKDCKCESNEYCSGKTKLCESPQCGNDVCEPFESPENCCIDCECTIPGEVCNVTTHQCEMEEVKLSEEKIKQLIIEYFENQGKTVISTEILETMKWEDKVGKKVRVSILEEWLRYVLVTKNEEVIELPTL